MKLFKQKTPPRPEGPTRAQAMSAKPVRNPQVQEDILTDTTIRLVYTIEYKPWFAKLTAGLARNAKPIVKRVELDEMGTAAWRLMDGKRTVQGLVDEFAQRYSITPQEAGLSIAVFLRELGKRGLILLAEDEAE